MGKFVVTRDLLKKRKCTIKKLASDLGISGTYVSMLLDGTTQYPPSEKLSKKIEQWLKCCHVCGQELKKKDE